MFGPTYLDTLTFFYPIGNTPATNLAQDLPIEEKGDILLLGCGDVRNILFTLYSEQNASRELDFTCCDIQEAVIARNILVLALILADTDGKEQERIWNIYYHFYLDEESQKLLCKCAMELVSLSSTMDKWHKSRYGRMLRFCDESTFHRVIAMWKSYCEVAQNPADKTTIDGQREANLQLARDVRAYYVGDGMITTGSRSAAPMGVEYLKDAHGAYDHYWKHGSISEDPDVLAATKLPNPMFASQSATLHYGTDPLLGFHLATAFATFVKTAPLAVDNTAKSTLARVVGAAQIQFRAWCNALRHRSQGQLTIRFFSGDAISFSHALHGIGFSDKGQSGNIYRDPYHLDPIKLETGEYTTAKNVSPSFNVVDTSNLIDHLGALNLLAATSPLLRNVTSSSLYSESLVKQEKDHDAYIRSLLCGDFATMTLLLDLFPLEFWTDASSSSTAEEIMLDTAFRLTGAPQGGQMRVKLTWKRQSSLQQAKGALIERKLRLDEIDLAHIFHLVYQDMFQHENMMSLMANMDTMKVQKTSMVRYHRGSFAAFLRLVRSRVLVDWQEVMHETLKLIESDSSILMGTNYIQELFLYLHDLGLYSVDVLTRPFRDGTLDAVGMGTWRELPPTVCVTVKVPRTKLNALTIPKATEIGTPIAHCIVQSPMMSKSGPWQNIFADIQVAFGTIETSGIRHSNDFTVRVFEDELRWKGKSPLIVSFKTPSWFLLLEPKTAIVAFGLQSTPQTVSRFLKSLGPELSIYTTTLGNEENVFVTRLPPNSTGPPLTHGFHSQDFEQENIPLQEYKVTMTANISRSNGRATSLIGHVDLISKKLQDTLRSGCVVKSTQTGPCQYSIIFQAKGVHLLLQYPVPILGRDSKTRIARKSSYVEVEAPIDTSVWETFPAFIPAQLQDKTVISRPNLHRLDMRMLPQFDRASLAHVKWLTPHTALMLSGKERRLREGALYGLGNQKPGARVNFKDSLFSLFMHYTGVQAEKADVFGLSNENAGGIQIVIFVSCIKLDLGSQTVVLDVAMLPLTMGLLPRIQRFIEGIHKRGICQIKVDDEELHLWKQMLPCMAERCRQWKHRPSCEYALGKSIHVHDAANVLCSCGEGCLPKHFMADVPRWSELAKFCTRAAISPLFSVPIVDPPHDGLETLPPSATACRVCGKAETNGGGKLLKCSACRDAEYCSTTCQKADWKKHKRTCNKQR